MAKDIKELDWTMAELNDIGRQCWDEERVKKGRPIVLPKRAEKTAEKPAEGEEHAPAAAE